MTSLNTISRFEISGLNYYQNYEFALDQPVTIVVGESGLGKTKILHLLYLVLSRRWFVLAKQQFDFISLKFIDDSFVEFSSAELDVYLLSKIDSTPSVAQSIVEKMRTVASLIERAVNGAVVYFPVYRNLIEDLELIGKKFNQAPYMNEFSPMEIEEVTQVERDILIPSSFKNLLTGWEPNPEMIHTVRSLCNNYLLGITVEIISENKSTLFRIRNKKTDELVDFPQLSSGERQLLYFFLKIASKAGPNVYVLFDEPELSIPVDWQRNILPDLYKIKENTWSLVITHSPFVFDNSLDTTVTGIYQYKKDING